MTFIFCLWGYMKKDISLKAVLTGDIVGSTKLDNNHRFALFDTFPKLSKLLMAQYPKEIPFPISNFRGDSWQLIVNNPEYSLEISLLIRTYFRSIFRDDKLDTRIAIGIGKVDFIPPENITAGDGPAFILSGRLFDGLNSKRLDIGFDVRNNEAIKYGSKSIILLIDFIISNWGDSQCQAIFLALRHYRQNEIAENWLPNPITQPAVSKALKTAGWRQIQPSLDSFKHLLEQIS